MGTVVLSAPTSGTITVSSTSYSGVTKVGGGGNAPTISQNNGYYALTTGRVIVKSNGTQGSNSDAVIIITIYTIWDEVPNGLTVSSGSATTLTARPPSTTNIANTWGAITLAGSVTGS